MSPAPLRVVVVLIGLLVVTAVGSAQTGTTGGEWRFYNGDAGSTRYAPFDQINKDTVKDLMIAWRWKTENPGPRPETNYQATPLMVDGVLYVTAGAERDVGAIDAETGATRWVWRYDEGARGEAAPRKNHRGVAHWTDGTEGRIVYIPPGYNLISLDAQTGLPDPRFGSKGLSISTTISTGRDPEPAPSGRRRPPSSSGTSSSSGRRSRPSPRPRRTRPCPTHPHQW